MYPAPCNNPRQYPSTYCSEFNLLHLQIHWQYAVIRIIRFVLPNLSSPAQTAPKLQPQDCNRQRSRTLKRRATVSATFFRTCRERAPAGLKFSTGECLSSQEPFVEIWLSNVRAGSAVGTGEGVLVVGVPQLIRNEARQVSVGSQVDEACLPASRFHGNAEVLEIDK